MLRLYNYLSRRKEIFKPLKKGFVSTCPHTKALVCKSNFIKSSRKEFLKHRFGVGVYSCGPTVYNFAHLGNLRTYIFNDILRRVLEYNGFMVRAVMNITDIDDKIIKSIREKYGNKVDNWKETIAKFTAYYIKIFFSDIKALNIKRADFYPRATRHIGAMIEMIAALVEKKYAYITEDGVYFNIKKFKNYGNLSRLKNCRIKLGARIAIDEYQKDNVSDFALWKFRHANGARSHFALAKCERAHANNNEPAWQSPWGLGRPGWHVECSAMSVKYLGQPFDIHTGAVDLLFPHHENEIAEAEAAFSKKFVNYFVEAGHLKIYGNKMAKSLGNVLTLKDIIEKDFDPLAFRYLCLLAHYRTQLNFTWQGLEAAFNSLKHLRHCMADLAILEAVSGENDNFSDLRQLKIVSAYQNRFRNFINDDLNMPRALAEMQVLVSDQNISAQQKISLLLEFDQIIGLGLEYYYQFGRKEIKKIRSLAPLLRKREEYRKEGRWKMADNMRQAIEKMGYKIEDAAYGAFIKIGNRDIFNKQPNN